MRATTLALILGASQPLLAQTPPPDPAAAPPLAPAEPAPATLNAEPPALAPAPEPPPPPPLLVPSEPQAALVPVEPTVLSPPPVVPPPATTLQVSGEPGTGIVLTTADGRLGMNIRGRAQIREQLSVIDDEVTQQTNVKTLRLYLQGHILQPELKYTIQLAFGAGDFEEGNSSPIFDAYLEYVKIRDLNVRVGQYFVPFDRARTVREFSLQLVDRPVLIPELTLDRDVGITFSSSDLFGLGKRLSYALSVFGGDGRNRFTTAEPGLLYALRLAVTPFGSFDDNSEGDLDRKPEFRLMVGVAGAYNQQTARARSTTGRTLVLDPYDYAHGAADLVIKVAGFSFMAEAVVRKANDDSREGEDAEGESITEFSRSGYGYLAQAGYMLTNHFEIAGRWGHVFAFDDTDPTLKQFVDAQAHEITAGVNYYINKHFLKLQADYSVRFGDEFGDGQHFVRAQVDASF